MSDDTAAVLAGLAAEMRDHAKSWHDRSEAQAGFNSCSRGNLRELWRDVARAVLAAAPPAPSAHGVAELLAEARRRLEHAPGAVMFCDEIVRDLAPEGGQS